MGASPLSATFFPFTGSSNSLTITIPSSVPDFILNCEHLHSTVSAAAVELWTFVRNCWDLIVRTRPDNWEAGQRGRRTCASASACFVAQIHSWEIQLRNTSNSWYQHPSAFLERQLKLQLNIKLKIQLKFSWEIYLRAGKRIHTYASASACFVVHLPIKRNSLLTSHILPNTQTCETNGLLPLFVLNTSLYNSVLASMTRTFFIASYIAYPKASRASASAHSN